MPQVAEDPGIVGPSYQATMTLQDAENAINWYLEVAEVEGAKEPVALLGTPGLNTVANPGLSGAVRGMWVLPGGSQFLFVVASTLLVGTLTVPATQNAIAQFSIATVGTLLTNNGPVVIRDNGVVFGGKGGYAVIVDGQYGYYYRIAGAGTVTFTGALGAGSPIITLPGVLPNGLLISPGAVVTDSASLIPSTTISSIDYNTPAITLAANATGTVGSDTFTITIAQFGRITDPGFLGADRVAFIEGWLIFNQPGSRTFYTTGPTAYTLIFPGSFFALKDSSTDNLITLQENSRDLWLIGERSSEVWFNSGGAAFAFARVPGVGPQIGCSAVHSISRLGPSLMWLAKNEQGENMVIQTSQYGWQRVSNHAVEHAISSYPLVSDAIGYAYEEEGHGFYVLIFPTADNCWVYDVTSSEMLGKPCWHQRLSFDPVAGVYHRHRSNCFIDFQNLRLVGDYQTGKIHQMSRAYFTDAGNPLRAQRRTKHVWDKPSRKRVFQSSLQIEFTPGVGLQSGQGSSPQAMVRWSNDGGFTWSNEYWRTIGAAGVTKNRAKWNRLGRARDRVYELNFSEPVARDVIGATLFGEAEEV